ncbi:MAG TPA: amino acid-binding protein [Lentisphaeria bacterium]|nr:MAG: amino acid-binding protein [Lentisphaerae bacterium GWF2_50_93]HCE42406.1 amino acid-binding protein [Lentisphaeria bacterium]
MKIKQVSIFIENKAGTLSAPCKLLSDAGINIVTLCLADTNDFGIMRLIVKDWQKAKKLLESKDYAVKITDVVAIEVEDRPGGLASILSVLEKSKLNVEYMYAFTSGKNGRAVLVFCFENPDEAVQILSSKGINVLGETHIFQK